MGHQAKRRSKPLVKRRGNVPTVARTGVSCRPSGLPVPQQPGPLAGLGRYYCGACGEWNCNCPVEQIRRREREKYKEEQEPKPSPLAGLNLSDTEWDSLFCMAVKHHFEQEQVWVPSVLRTMALLEGINDKTGRPCRIYVRPNRRVIMVETLS